MISNLADLPLDLPPDLPPSVLTSSGQDEFLIWQIYAPVLTASGQDEFKFGRSTPDDCHVGVKMICNLADLPLDMPADLSPHTEHLVVKMSSNLADLLLDLPPDLPLLGTYI